ncbi:MAG: nucleoid-associated protein [Bacteroidales bacterium]|jgi:hypothetical protein|nr:nucleoid-associated protein [Bacteroidales bacterium]
MIQCYDTKIRDVAVHFVGNKSNDAIVRCSKSLLTTNEDIDYVLTDYFLKPFLKTEEQYQFFHDTNLKYNEVLNYVSEVFDNPESLLQQSINLARHLYEQSAHPKIKGGEFYTVYFKDCIIDGETADAVGLFKSENKDTFLKVFPQGEGFEIESEKGININKLDKGCLIFNTERENGYIVAVVDNTNKGVEAQYWTDDFLNIRQRKDEYYNTQNLLSLCKNFVRNELPQQFDVSKADQIDLLNRSVQFFREKDNFNLSEFASEVIAQPDVIEKFNQYKSSYAQEYEVDFADNFTISDSAVKKQARVLKSVIKLDKNVHIYIHGNREVVEQGEDGKGKYYKIYYKEEF